MSLQISNRNMYNLAVICVVFVSVIVWALSNQPYFFPNKYDVSKISPQLTVAIQITLALTGIIATLYINKIHDCKREYIRQVGELEAVHSGVRLLLSNLDSTRIQQLRSDLERWYCYFQDITNRFQRLPKLIIIITLVIFVLVLWSLYALNFDEMTLGNFIFIMTNWGLAVFLLFLVWLLYEDVLSTYYERLRQMSVFIGAIQGVL